jgi:hypothetical protein
MSVEAAILWPRRRDRPAVVTGRLRGFSVSARFGRKDGCQIARCNRVAFLFPGLGTSQSGG